MNRRRIGALVGLILISLAFHGSALRGWWLSDDPQVLIQAVRDSPREYFFVPEAWRYLSSSNFTPLVTLSFEADLAVGGLDPRPFYLHQFLALTLCAVLLYFYLVPWTGDIAALAGALLFLVSPQAILSARMLMVRHYVEGLALALIALLLWRRGRAGGVVSTLLAAVAYLLAMLAKEVYATLPLFMLFESSAAQEPGQRLARRIAPVTLAAAGYVIWRMAILGSMGGYGREVSFGGMTRALWQNLLVGPPLPVSIAVGVGLILLLVRATAKRSAATFAFVLTAVLVIILPLVPVAGQVEPRYGFFAFAIVCASFALALSVVRPRSVLGATAGSIVLIAVLIAGQIVQKKHSLASERVVAEGRFVWDGGPAGSILLADAPGWYLEGLRDLRARNQTTAPVFLLSRDGLVIEPVDLQRVVAANAEGDLTPLPATTMDAVTLERRLQDPSLPIAVSLSRRGNRVEWSFSPEPTTEWTFLSYPGYDEYAIPAAGARVIPDPSGRQFFRVRREVSDGRWTVTPPLELPAAEHVVTWPAR